MKLSFTTLGCPDWTLQQIVENAAQMGYDGIDFRGLQQEIDITLGSSSGADTVTINVSPPLRVDEALVSILCNIKQDTRWMETTRHELGHAVGMGHNSDDSCLMYQYSNNWVRDHKFSNTAKQQMFVYNK